MNHCRDCNSDYAVPGTCNCFAVGGKRSLEQMPYWVPWMTTPYIPYIPCIPYVQPITWTGGSVTITNGTNVCSGTNTVTLAAALAGASNSCGM